MFFFETHCSISTLLFVWWRSRLAEETKRRENAEAASEKMKESVSRKEELYKQLVVIDRFIDIFNSVRGSVINTIDVKTFKKNKNRKICKKNMTRI